MDIYSMSYNDIMNIDDNKVKLEMLEEYQKLIREVKDAFSDIVINPSDSIITIYGKLEEQCSSQITISDFLFPGSRIHTSFYMKTLHAKKIKKCSFCPEFINPKETYILYQPLIYNFSDKKTYKLYPPFNLKESCNHYLPESTEELEQLIYNMNYYDNSKELSEYFPNNLGYGNDIDFIEMSLNTKCRFKSITRRKNHG